MPQIMGKIIIFKYIYRRNDDYITKRRTNPVLFFALIVLFCFFLSGPVVNTSEEVDSLLR